MAIRQAEVRELAAREGFEAEDVFEIRFLGAEYVVITCIRDDHGSKMLDVTGKSYLKKEHWFAYPDVSTAAIELAQEQRESV